MVNEWVTPYINLHGYLFNFRVSFSDGKVDEVAWMLHPSQLPDVDDANFLNALRGIHDFKEDIGLCVLAMFGDDRISFNDVVDTTDLETMQTLHRNLCFARDLAAGLFGLEPSTFIMSLISLFGDELNRRYALLDRQLVIDPNAKRGEIYVVRGGDKFKIGMTNDTSKRIKSLQTSSPQKLELVLNFSTPDVATVEKWLHETFSSHRVNGEWFSLNQFDLDYIVWIGQSAGAQKAPSLFNVSA